MEIIYESYRCHFPFSDIGGERSGAVIDTGIGYGAVGGGMVDNYFGFISQTTPTNT
jgi:hypothetical protein